MNPIIYALMVTQHQLDEIREDPARILELDQKEGYATVLERTILFFLTDDTSLDEYHPLASVFGNEIIDSSALDLGHLRLLTPEELTTVADSLSRVSLDEIKSSLDFWDLEDLVETGRIDDIDVFPDGETEGDIAWEIERLLSFYKDAAEKGVGLGFYEVGLWPDDVRAKVEKDRRQRIEQLQEANRNRSSSGPVSEPPPVQPITKDEVNERFRPYYAKKCKMVWEHRRGFEASSDAVFFDPAQLDGDLKEMLDLLTASFADRLDQLTPFALLVEDTGSDDLFSDESDDLFGEFTLVAMALGMMADLLVVDQSTGKVMIAKNGTLEDHVDSLADLKVTVV